MSFHTLSTLQGWVDEFAKSHAPLVNRIQVLVQDGEAGADTGLVEIKMEHATTVTTIEPDAVGSRAWVAKFEPRDTTLTLAADDVMRLSRELAVVSELCTFLESKAATAPGDLSSLESNSPNAEAQITS